jgi:hypothetical protein
MLGKCTSGKIEFRAGNMKLGDEPRMKIKKGRGN